jgi:hypothetical protein
VTNPREHHEGQGEQELDLDPETVKDLEPSEEDAAAARGGAVRNGYTEWVTCGCPPTWDCRVKVP